MRGTYRWASRRCEAGACRAPMRVRSRRRRPAESLRGRCAGGRCRASTWRSVRCSPARAQARVLLPDCRSATSGSRGFAAACAGTKCRVSAGFQQCSRSPWPRRVGPAYALIRHTGKLLGNFSVGARAETTQFAGAFDAGGGTRTPDTRIMISAQGSGCAKLPTVAAYEVRLRRALAADSEIPGKFAEMSLAELSLEGDIVIGGSRGARDGWGSYVGQELSDGARQRGAVRKHRRR
jgi:hypothetical protein